MAILSIDFTNEVANIVFNLGVVLAGGLFFGRVVEKIGIPAITGYLIAGLVIGPICGIISISEANTFSIISDIALAFIAFQVGNELWLGKLKKTGKKIIVITIIQALITTVIVIGISSLFVDLPIALVLGAIAAATAPAPIMIIVKKYKAKGELTDTAVSLTGLDDVIGILFFSILLSISLELINPSKHDLHIIEFLEKPLIEIGISIIIGTVIGFISGLLMKHISINDEQSEKDLTLILITILLATGIAMFLESSPILTPMMAGAVVTNMINKETYKVEDNTIRSFIPPLMIVFFTLAGTQLQFKVVFAAGVLGAVYIISRTIGKLGGSLAGTYLTKSSTNLKKYLGFTLLSQSGVAIGLSVAAYNSISLLNMEYALIIKNVVLASILFFELIGPTLVKISLCKAKEIK